MTTVDEFNKITQAMYDNGYVLIDLHDMVTETTDENGTVHFTTNQIMLPEGKNRLYYRWMTCLTITVMTAAVSLQK